MSSAKRLFLAACVASSFAMVGCASDSDHSSRSDRGTNGTYDNATSAGTRNQGGAVGVGPSSSNDNVPNSSDRVPAHDKTNTGSDSSSRIDARPGVGGGNAGAASDANNAAPGINGGAGDRLPDGKTGVGGGNADTATGVNNARPGNAGTDTPATPKGTPADKSDSAAGVGSGNSDTAAGTDSGAGDTEKK